MTGVKSLYNAQEEIYELCKDISKSIGLERRVCYNLYHADEYDIFYSTRLYLQAPCGCCKTLPYIYPSNMEDMINKFEKIKRIDKRIRESIDELATMYDIDLLWILDSDSNYICNDDINNKFWEMSEDEIVEKYIKKYNNTNEEMMSGMRLGIMTEIIETPIVEFYDKNGGVYATYTDKKTEGRAIQRKILKAEQLVDYIDFSMLTEKQSERIVSICNHMISTAMWNMIFLFVDKEKDSEGNEKETIDSICNIGLRAKQALMKCTTEEKLIQLVKDYTSINVKISFDTYSNEVIYNGCEKKDNIEVFKDDTIEEN